MTNPDNTPNNVSMDRPNVARMYDYFLGGSHNFIIDRKAAEHVLSVYPEAILGAKVNRAFLGRAVSYALEQGVDQFLDIGSGIPTAGNVHEIVHTINPEARVVYVDNDPIAVAQSKQLLTNVPHTEAVLADARQPQDILEHPAVTNLLDFDRPVAVLMIALLHFIPEDDEAKNIIKSIRNVLSSGSYLVISHGTSEHVPPDVIEKVAKLYAMSNSPAGGRTKTELTSLFTGFNLIEPHIVFAPEWRPTSPDDLGLDDSHRTAMLAGVGRKP